jgi:hypothetical protein
MKRSVFALVICLLIFSFFIIRQKPFVTVDFRGQLGNQLFQAAAAANLALENGCKVILPKNVFKSENAIKILWRFLSKKGLSKKIKYYYRQPDENNFSSIEFHPNMQIIGYFESEKFFKKNKDKILELFAPSEDITSYLTNKYKNIIDHPKSVSIHVRTYYEDYLKSGVRLYYFLPGPDISYIEKAIKMFDEDSLFVVFSDYIPWCKKNLSHLSKNLIFIENEKPYHDLYLMSMCKHNIISNSTFSWWGAYLNTNSNKRVICRVPWDVQNSRNWKDIILDEWVKIEGSSKIFIPYFDEECEEKNKI